MKILAPFVLALWTALACMLVASLVFALAFS
jgi:hypothetical protein